MTVYLPTTEDILDNICRTANAMPGPAHPALHAGLAGTLLFEYMNSKRTGTDSAYFHQAFETLSGTTIEEVNATFCTGKSGINWLYGFLYREGLLDQEDLELLCCDNELLLQLALQELHKNNYDFLHGAVGIAYALLYQFKADYTPAFTLIFEQLERLMNHGRGMIPDFDSKSRELLPGRVNLGLAHGIPAILKFCMQCYTQDVCREQAFQVAERIISFLLENRNPDTTYSYFAYITDTAVAQPAPSRLGWCYGDLSIAVILYQAGQLFARPQLAQLAVTVALHAAARQSDEATQVCDAGICHGSAGLAYMFLKMDHYTGRPEFKTAAGYWIDRTAAYATFEDGPAGFKKFNPASQCFENDYGLLEGIAGIGLVLYTYLTGDFSWDYCLMLND